MLFFYNDLFVVLVFFGDFYLYGVIEGDIVDFSYDDGSLGVILILVFFLYFN